MLSIISTASTVHKALFRALVRPCAPVRLSATLVERQFFQAANIVSGFGLESAYCVVVLAVGVDDKGREAGHARCRTAPPSTERSCVRFKWFRSRAERLCVRHRRRTVTNRHVQTRSSGSLHAAQIPRAYKTRPARGVICKIFHSKLSCKVIQEKSTTFCTELQCFPQTDT